MACSADGQRAGGDRGCSRVGFHTGEREGACAALGEGAVSADDAAQRLVRAAGVVEGAGVGDVAGVVARTELACAADRKRAGVDGGGAGVGVHTGEGECVAAVLGEPAGAADRSADGDVAGGGVIDSRGVAREGEVDRLSGSGVVDDVAVEGERAGGVVAGGTGVSGERVGSGGGVKGDRAEATQRGAGDVVGGGAAGAGEGGVGAVGDRGGESGSPIAGAASPDWVGQNGVGEAQGAAGIGDCPSGGVAGTQGSSECRGVDAELRGVEPAHTSVGDDVPALVGGLVVPIRGGAAGGDGDREGGAGGGVHGQEAGRGDAVPTRSCHTSGVGHFPGVNTATVEREGANREGAGGIAGGDRAADGGGSHRARAAQRCAGGDRHRAVGGAAVDY